MYNQKPRLCLELSFEWPGGGGDSDVVAQFVLQTGAQWTTRSYWSDDHTRGRGNQVIAQRRRQQSELGERCSGCRMRPNWLDCPLPAVTAGWDNVAHSVVWAGVRRDCYCSRARSGGGNAYTSKYNTVSATTVTISVNCRSWLSCKPQSTTWPAGTHFFCLPFSDQRKGSGFRRFQQNTAGLTDTSIYYHQTCAMCQHVTVFLTHTLARSMLARRTGNQFSNARAPKVSVPIRRLSKVHNECTLLSKSSDCANVSTSLSPW